MVHEVLAFGDSLTWGSRPEDGARHPFVDRWPNVLGAGLTDTHVVAEGLRGRTTVFDQHASPADMNGARILPSLLHSHGPLDLVIIMLGSNDVYLGLPIYRIRSGLMRLIEIIRHHPLRVDDVPIPDILLVSPPHMVPSVVDDITDSKIALSQALASMIKLLAGENECAFFDAASVAQASPIDGLHLDAVNTRAIGAKLIPNVSEILSRR